jgi:hypothetical protein
MKANQITQRHKRNENMGAYQKFLSGWPSGAAPARPGGHPRVPFDTIMLRTGLVIFLAMVCVLDVSLRGYAASGSERITFKSTDSAVSAQIPATVFRPKGTGPFPGVVLLHVCSGIRECDSKCAEWLETLEATSPSFRTASPREICPPPAASVA